MRHMYNISGMTCDSCSETVKKALMTVGGVSEVKVDRHLGEAEITMHHHVDTELLKDALKAHPKYHLSEKRASMPLFVDEEKTWFQTYKPVLLIFAYITGATLLIQAYGRTFDRMQWMNHFMAGFFLTFSFFKLLNLPGFADSYATYDIIARRWRGWGHVYAFIELGLGISYLLHFNPLITNILTLLVMGVSIIGVLQSVLDKRKIRCACLGDVFNLPMSTITILEDALMILMSALMIFALVSGH